MPIRYLRRFTQSVLLTSLCVFLAITFNVFYVGMAIAAASLALATGVTIVLSIGLALVWPVLAFSYVLYVTKSRAQAPTPTTSEPLPGVEDPKHREN